MGKPQPRDGQRLVQPYAQRRRRARVGELRALGKSEYRGIDSSCRSISGFLVTSTISLFFTATPVGRKVMRPFPLMARNYETDRPATTSSYPSTTLVAEQDKPVVESHRPEELPFDLSAEPHIRGGDKVSIGYRKCLIETNELVTA